MAAKLSPSILNADFGRLYDEIKLLEEEGVINLHLDIMDGHYVPNLSFGPSVVKSIRSMTDMTFDAHLMVDNPDDLIEAFADAGCQYVTIHPETSKHPHRTLSRIRELGMGAGICLNPGTPTGLIEDLLPVTDLILVMGVNPGFGGQSYIPETTDKVRRVKEMIEGFDHGVLIQVDGGVKEEETKVLASIGADLIVVGSAIFQKEDKRGQIKKYQNLLLG